MEIIIHPNKLLRKKCKDVKNLISAKKIKKMFQLMYNNNGIGLAAPQVGWNINMFIINLTKEPDKELVFINPQILKTNEEMVEMDEGCLSIPGVIKPVIRPKYVLIKAQNLNGQHFYLEDDNLLSRCIQHEYDHLNGILFIDKTS